MSAWTDAGVVALQELRDARRSRRALIVFVLFLAFSIGATNVLVTGLQTLEQELMETLRLTNARGSGVVTNTLWETPQFRRAIERGVRDAELADALVNTPPIALLFGWISFFFAPFLVVLVASSRVAEELATGSARFALVRTGLLPWCLGKYVGMALLLIPALILAALGAWVTAWFRLDFFQPGPAAWALASFGLKVWLFSLFYVGLALGMSQVTRSVNAATALCLVVMIGTSVLAGLSRWDRVRAGSWASFWDSLRLLLPQGHRLDLWWPDAAHMLPAAVMLAALGFLWMVAGHVVLRRRDW